jgi:hypothetical protein
VYVNETGSPDPQVGYGDTRLSGSVTLGDRKDVKRTWVVGMQLTVPTRTIKYESDPGSQWLLSPVFSFTQALEAVRFFAMVLTPVEFRPAGIAIEVSPSAGAGYQWASYWSTSMALGMDVRVASYCHRPTGTEFCSEGRASETDREIGATRLYAGLTNWLRVSESWSTFQSVQFPLTELQDFSIGANLGFEARL